MDVFSLKDHILHFNKKFYTKKNTMNNNDLKLYVEDVLTTLTSLSIDFKAIIQNLESNQNDAVFIRTKLDNRQFSLKESNFIDNILVEYLSTNILSVIDPKQNNELPRIDKEISNYDILKLAINISGRENILNAETIKISEIKEIHKKIDCKKLLEIKTIRDQHYSHIDKKRKDDTEVIVSDIVEIIQLFLKMFDLILKATKGVSIFDIPIIQLFIIKLKAFKYDMMMKYLNESENPNLKILKSMNQHSTFEDSYKSIFNK